MLQRIQTIWLLLAGAAALLTLKLAFYSGLRLQTGPSVPAAYSKLTGTSSFWLLFVTIAVALIAFIATGLYKTRVIQLRLCVVGIILEALLIFLYYRAIQSGYAAGGEYSATALIHLLTLLFFVLAARGINKDEKLLKESDRLR